MFKTIVKGCEPTKGSKYSACIDLYASEDVVIGAGETVLVGLGVVIDLDYIADNTKMYKWAKRKTTTTDETLKKIKEDALSEFMKKHQLNLHIRSSMSAKKGLIIANGTGIIDLDYPDEIKICLHNPMTMTDAYNSNIAYSREVTITKGQPIAQISLVEHKSYLFGVESQDDRTGGFGSTDEHKS